MIEPPEVIEVTETRICCDGGGGALGHPRVYLTIGATGFVECGYCDRKFVLKGSPAAADAAARIVSSDSPADAASAG